MMRATIWGGRAGTGVRVSYFAFTQGLLLFSVARAINSPSFTLCSGHVPLPAWSCPWKEQPGYSGTHLSAVTGWAWLDLWSLTQTDELMQTLDSQESISVSLSLWTKLRCPEISGGCWYGAGLEARLENGTTETAWEKDPGPLKDGQSLSWSSESWVSGDSASPTELWPHGVPWPCLRSLIHCSKPCYPQWVSASRNSNGFRLGQTPIALSLPINGSIWGRL